MARPPERLGQATQIGPIMARPAATDASQLASFVHVRRLSSTVREDKDFRTTQAKTGDIPIAIPFVEFLVAAPTIRKRFIGFSTMDSCVTSALSLIRSHLSSRRFTDVTMTRSSCTGQQRAEC